jgi:hypothetical protein
LELFAVVELICCIAMGGSWSSIAMGGSWSSAKGSGFLHQRLHLAFCQSSERQPACSSLILDGSPASQQMAGEELSRVQIGAGGRLEMDALAAMEPETGSADSSRRLHACF